MRLPVVGLARETFLRLWSVPAAKMIRIDTDRGHRSACRVHNHIQEVKEPVYIAACGWSIRCVVGGKHPRVTDNGGALATTLENGADGRLSKYIETKEGRNVG
jgi:hypothetical protein